MATSPVVIAHRGASGYRPEHTRAAYELAIAMGADAVEPDLVATRDGVLVLRHESELSATTDVASRPEFADRRTKKMIDGAWSTGWFTEDFTWTELSCLRAVERLPHLRRASAAYDGHDGILRLRDLIAILDDADRQLVLVAEIKHASYFQSIGLPLGELLHAEIGNWATPENLIVESFERTVLQQLRALGLPGRQLYLIEDEGSPADLVASLGSAAPTYADQLSSLESLVGSVDGVSVNTSRLDDASRPSDLLERAHAVGLVVFCWTLRAENLFLPERHRLGSDPSDWGDWMEAFRRVIRTGVDGVFADQPDRAIEARTAEFDVARHT